jgi:hypothetical protein
VHDIVVAEDLAGCRECIDHRRTNGAACVSQVTKPKVIWAHTQPPPTYVQPAAYTVSASTQGNAGTLARWSAVIPPDCHDEMHAALAMARPLLSASHR